MDWDEWLMRRLVAPLAFPLFLAAVFALLWVSVSRLTRRRAVRLTASIIGTLLAGVVAFLIVWAQASGS